MEGRYENMKIAASILAANPLYLGQSIKEMEASKIDIIHVDIMDGHYVENFTFGINTVESIARETNLPIEVHLEVSNPEAHIEHFKKAGTNILTVQLDTCKHPIRVLETIRANDMKAGLAINPHIGLEAVEYLIDHFDYLLLMSVEPGFGGQKFEESVINKTVKANQIISKAHKNIEIGVDGGINKYNIGKLYEAGASIFIIGNSLYSNGGINKNSKILRKSVKKLKIAE